MALPTDPNIAFVQPWSLNAEGGGSRILRSLLEGAPAPYVSVVASPFPRDRADGHINVPRRPYFGSLLERISGRLGNPLEYVTLLSAARFKGQLLSVFRTQGITAVHSIPQGMEFWYTYETAREANVPFYLTVHDDLPYNLQGYPYLDRAMDRLGECWRGADGRMVISEAMGKEYNRRYGTRPYEVVTDGLRQIASEPQLPLPKRCHVYFMGSVHLSYRDNFQSLLNALNQLQKQSRDVRLSVRGNIPFDLDSGAIDLRPLPWGTQADIKADMDEADYLYFPLPFEAEHECFVRYSLSTKMVTYLGSGVPILFHGPAQSAAGELLRANKAAVPVWSNDVEQITAILRQAHGARASDVVRNALSLAKNQFRIETQRHRFWSMLLGDTSATTSATV